MCGSLSLYNLNSPHTVGAIHIFVRQRQANTSVDAQLAKWRLPGRTMWRGPRNGAANEASSCKQLRRLALKLARVILSKKKSSFAILRFMAKNSPHGFQNLIVLMCETIIMMGNCLLLYKGRM